MDIRCGENDVVQNYYNVLYRNTDGGKRVRLNAAGDAVYYRWYEIYNNELDRLRAVRHDPDFHEGWCIIDCWPFVQSIEDAVGLWIFGYDNDAIWNVFQSGYGPNDIWMFDTTTSEFLRLLEPYFDKLENLDNENTIESNNTPNHEKEFKINATIYLPANNGDTVEELIDRLLMLVDPDLQLQVYEETAEIYDV